jgi:UDP-N-acetylmuramoyl-L-alanyl-D-glutamate--2,6-diaminopimelate ligase
MRLRELASLLLLSSIEGDEDTEILGVETDSRRVKSGDLFICLPGFKTDGHDYAAEAVKRGAVALVVERDVSAQCTKLFVKDAHFAVSLIASHFYNHPTNDLKVIGVTGTNGKTTITYLLDRIFSNHYKTGVIGTIGLKINGEVLEKDGPPTTPEALQLQKAFQQMRDVNTDYAMVEVSSHALEQGRVRGTNFHTAIFSNFTQDHMEFHGTMENYRHAKGLFFSQLGNQYEPNPAFNKYAVLNADDPTSEYFTKITAAQVITYGIDKDADVRASKIEITNQGTRFYLQSFRGNIDIRMKLIGKFNVYNTLAAITAALIEGIPLSNIQTSLEQMDVVNGRFEAVDEGQNYTVIVDYAHTPDGVENVLNAVKEFAIGKIYTVVGCGGDRDKTKRPIMGRISADYSDVVIVTSDNPRTEDPQEIVNDVVKGIIDAGYSDDQYVAIVDRTEAIRYAIELAQAGDVIVIAGKGHETYQEINGQKIDFDDRVVARKAIQRMSEQ